MKNILLSLAFAATLLAVPAHADDAPGALDLGPKEALVVKSASGSHTFSVEIADDPAERTRGMMFRDVVAPMDGMLFEFDNEQVASIWMKNTSVFLDILFVRKDGRILKIVHSAQPYSMRSVNSEAPVTAVLELAGGQAHALGIKAGDKVEHSFFKN